MYTAMRASTHRFTSILTQLVSINLLVLLAVLSLVVLAGAVFVPQTMQAANLANVGRMTSIIAIGALGQMLVMLLGEIDLSLGSIMSFSLIVGAEFLNVGSSAAILATCVTGMFLGLINGIAVVHGGVSSLIVTLATMSIFGGGANLIAGGQAKYLYGFDGYLWFGKGDLFGLPVPATVLLALTLVTALVLTFTGHGRAAYFVGANPMAAWYSGLPIRRLKVAVFAAAGLLAGFAGPMLASQTNRMTPSLGAGYELSSIAIAVLGGTALNGGRGSPMCTLVGACIFGMLLNVLALSGFGTYLEQVLKGVLLISVVALLHLVRRNGRDE